MAKTCSMVGCGGQAIAKGWCRRHYSYWRRRQPHFEDLVARASCPDAVEVHEYLRVVQRDPCSYCGLRFMFGGPRKGLDHIVPRARGGAEDWSNLTRACPACNIGKKSSSLLGFLMATWLHPTWTALRAEAKAWRLV